MINSANPTAFKIMQFLKGITLAKVDSYPV
jgi:hypothetical protein